VALYLYIKNAVVNTNMTLWTMDDNMAMMMEPMGMAMAVALRLG
jgi:hypothetical protein